MHRYQAKRCVGRGGGGEAILAEEADGTLSVLKCVMIGGFAKQHQRRALREVQMLRQLDHPNVLRVRQAFLHQHHLVITSEYCEAGDLDGLVSQRRSLALQQGAVPPFFGFSEPTALGIFVQICQALRYIHGHGVVHRDLKASNVLLTSRGVAKICDFGIAVARTSNLTNGGDNSEGGMRALFIGTIHHLPPEVCDGGEHTEAGDCWALGVLLYQMCALDLPFRGSNALSVVMRILEGRVEPLPSEYSPEIRSLCTGLLQAAVERRLSVSKVLAQPIIRSVQKDPDLSRHGSRPAVPTCGDDVLRQLQTAHVLAAVVGPTEYERFMMKQLEQKGD